MHYTIFCSVAALCHLFEQQDGRVEHVERRQRLPVVLVAAAIVELAAAIAVAVLLVAD